MRFLLSILLIIVLPNLAISQISRESASDIISEILEYAAESDDEDANSLAQISSEYLETLASNKLNINNCTFSDLQAIPFLTDFQISEILNYRIKFGEFCSVGELKSLESLTSKELHFLQFFLYAGDPATDESSNKKLFSGHGKHSITTTTKYLFEEQKGYKLNNKGVVPYDGNRLAWCIKYRYTNSDKLAWGFTADKDAGERITFDNKQLGFDFNSFFVKFQNCGKLDKLVVGDYIAKFGEGLIFGGGFSMGKFLSSANYAATENVIREYSSTNENWFYRGVAATLNFNRLKVSAFASRQQLDATATDSTFITLKNDGYHRNEKELKSKDAVDQYIASLIMSYNYKNFKIAYAAQYFKYNKIYVPREQKKNYFLPNFDEGMANSVNYRYCTRKFCFHGETALDNNNNLATINIFEVKPINFLKFSFLYRNYSKDYLSLTGNTFGENSKVSNERGFYFGTAIEPSKYLVIESWLDMFKFPWVVTSSVSPTSGYEYLLQSTVLFNRNFNISARYKLKEKNKLPGEYKFTRSQYIRLSSKYSPSKNLCFSNCAQWSFYDDFSKSQNGYLVYQNAQFKTNNLPFSFALRYALFSAPYNARIYAYENDVMYFFSVPAYYYKGSRYYAVVGYKFGKAVTLQFRLSRWQYFDRQTLSSGNSFIDDNKRTELNMYFRLVL